MRRCSIDGKAVATSDRYGPVRDTPFRYEVRELPPGRHTIRLTLLEEKNPVSRDRYANVTRFDVENPPSYGPESLPSASLVSAGVD